MANIGEMPGFFQSRKFDLDLAQQLSPSGEVGFIQTLNRTAPFWTAEYETAPLRGDRENDWIVFLDKLEGSMNSFLAYDPSRPMPYAYRTQPLANDPWTQTGQVAPRITAQDYAASTIDLDRMQNGAIITRGDYISVQVGIIWYLFRAMEDRVASSNAVVDLAVKPRPNIISLVATDIRYRQAVIEMKMMGKPDNRNSVGDLPNFQFKAAQYTARAPT